MAGKRVLVVDDSRVYQQLLSDVLNTHGSLDVVGVAENGEAALDMVGRLKPDLVTLDILMPIKDGIQTLIELREKWPQVRAIMVSSLTEKNSEAAADVMSLGASGVVSKSHPKKDTRSIRSALATDLLPQIDALYKLDETGSLPPGRARSSSRSPAIRSASLPQRTPEPVGRSQKIPARRPRTGGDLQLIAIGVSTGGPDALGKVLGALPGDLGVPIVIVQHMPAEFTAKLAARLNKLSELQVKEAQRGDVLQPNHVFIAPGDYHMVLERQGSNVVVELNQDPPEHSCRPSVDPLFRSIPPLFGGDCLGLIMTGMGGDGLSGCETLHAAGCPVIVQDKLTSVVWGMPKLVAMAGLAEQEIPLDQLADNIISRIRKGRPNSAGINQQRTTAGRFS